MKNNTFTIGVFGVILDGSGRILLCHRRDYDFWNLPGGALESNEVPWEGVVREIKEETGLDVEVARLIGVYSKPEVDDLVFTFLCTVVGGVVTLNDEAKAIEYFTFGDIPKNTAPKHLARIREVLENPNATLLKTQSGKTAIEIFKGR